MTFISESDTSYYSGMLPGAVSKLYSNSDIMLNLPGLAKWCDAEWIQQRVIKVEGNKNQVHLEDGRVVDYDILALNVGSKTKDTGNIKGVWEHSLTTRPINHLLPKIEKREQELLAQGKTPVVVICGAGAAGTELSFGFKKRWDTLFGKEIDMTLIASGPQAVHLESKQMKDQIGRILKEKNIKLITKSVISEVTENSVILKDNTVIPCDVAVWATGAEP